MANIGGFHIYHDGNGNPVQGAIDTQWDENGAIDTGVATASHAAEATGRHIITDILVSTDLNGAVVEVKSGATVKQKFDIPAATVFSHSFGTGIECVKNEAAVVTVTGTADCYANAVGYTIYEV